MHAMTGIYLQFISGTLVFWPDFTCNLFTWNQNCCIKCPCMYRRALGSLGIPGFPPGMPYGFVRINFFFLFFFFFRRQGFRMITFDRQAGPLQNFNRSHVMVIGRSVSFSDPARPPGGGVGRPKHPKIPPPLRKIKKKLHAFQNPMNIFEKKSFSREKKRFKTPGTFISEFFFSVKNSTSAPPPPPAHPGPSSEHSPQSSCNNK